uniref:DDE_Tnp_1_7 domain-containing protein n=1 Tax=Mesocestoides corti TaxID=53468 RepID=A0A5K3FI14_MESCO
MALWDKLPPLNEQAHKFQPVDKLKGTLSKKALDAFAPRHKHVQDPRMKQAIVIMDKMITKVMLVCAFPNIVDEMQVWSCGFMDFILSTTNCCLAEI